MAKHRGTRPTLRNLGRIAVVVALGIALTVLSMRALDRAEDRKVDPHRANPASSESTVDAGQDAVPSALDPIRVEMPEIDPQVWSARGEIVSDAPLTDLSPSVLGVMGNARRATYRSVSGITGEGTVVTGVFLTPRSTPPADGWPILSLAHSTPGMTRDCSPSLRSDLFGFDGAVVSALSRGTAVAITDYERLGDQGFQAYMEPRTEGFNVIDAVRSLRHLFPDTSTSWTAFGHSRGGQATWAANELNRFYGDGLTLRGTVALAPAANMSGLAELAIDQRLTNEQESVMPFVVMAVQQSYPGVPIDHLLHGAALDSLDEIIGCDSDAIAARATAVDPAAVKPTDPSDAESLAQSLRKLALPQEPVSAPMLVVIGTEDQTVPPAWIAAAVSQSCRLGGQIELIEQKGAGHGNLVADDQVLQWLGDRIAGIAAPTNCSTT